MKAKPECFPRAARTEHRRRIAEERSGYMELGEVFGCHETAPRSFSIPKFLSFRSPQRGDWRRRVDREFRLTYLCSRSCERSEQFARVPPRRARF